MLKSILLLIFLFSQCFSYFGEKYYLPPITNIYLSKSNVSFSIEQKTNFQIKNQSHNLIIKASDINSDRAMALERQKISDTKYWEEREKDIKDLYFLKNKEDKKKAKKEMLLYSSIVAGVLFIVGFVLGVAV